MCARKSDGFGRKFPTAAAACACALAILGAYCDDAQAQQQSAAVWPAQTRTVAEHAADLEKSFWICDYTATAGGVGATPIEVCSAITEDLKNEKFKGDFEELQKWWQRNKIAVHQNMRDQERLSQLASSRIRRPE